MLDDILRDSSAFGGLPLYLFTIAIIATSDPALAGRFLLALGLSYAVTILTRLVYFKERPQSVSYTNIIEKIDASSFPSMHSMRSANLAFLLGLHTFTGYAQLLLAGACILCLASRIHLRKHHLSDVIAGAAIGMILAYIV